MTTTTDYTASTTPRRSSYFSGCMSPSCVTVDEQYIRIKSGRRSSHHHRRKWKKMMNKVVEESKKSIYGSSQPLVFRYDEVSYSLNFDEGNHRDDHSYLYGSRRSQVLGECS